METIRWINHNAVQLIKICAVVLAVLLVYGYMMREDYDDEDSVTFTFSCTSVLLDRNSYPPDVIRACEQLRNQ